LAREIEAESECKGVFLTREGESRNIPGSAFFNGRRRDTERYRRYMSDELKAWFAIHGCNFTASEWMEQARPGYAEEW